MLRDEWEFEFTASKLVEATKVKIAHHAERLKWWEEAKAKVMAEVKESGIEVDEGMAAVANYSTTTNRGPQVMVRYDLQNKLSECHHKIREHQGKLAEYTGWEQVLAGNAESRLKLNSDDYLYFFGKK